ncbi:helix-turn-helix domain-containing protein [Nonomuraea sp. NEAU-A123]|uniref:helix-turn-helix domain-containing protein n=1 Tax=Nonomuraea sp. NEAU-A123 TaxID=2839649 RepID=UPI001BE417E6|nr:helix-turn-helix domain-containing protein [Nonomuraea sp. NEAU-A123]
MGGKLSESEKADVVQRYASGESASRIAKSFGVTRQAPTRTARQRGWWPGPAR